MRPSRGMGAMKSSKMPKAKTIRRKDNPDEVEMYAKGGKTGLYDNIHAKRKRIALGSGERMRKPGAKGAPTNAAFAASAKTAKKAKGGWIKDAVKKPGALRAQLGVKGDKPIPPKMLAKAAKAPGKLGQRARLAETFRKMRKK